MIWRKMIDFLRPESPEQIEAENLNMEFDKQKVDYALEELIISARKVVSEANDLTRAADRFLAQAARRSGLNVPKRTEKKDG